MPNQTATTYTIIRVNVIAIYRAAVEHKRVSAHLLVKYRERSLCFFHEYDVSIFVPGSEGDKRPCTTSGLESLSNCGTTGE